MTGVIKTGKSHLLFSMRYGSPYESSRLRDSLSSEKDKFGSSRTVGKMLPDECKGELLSISPILYEKLLQKYSLDK